MTLEQWLSNSWIQKIEPTSHEVRNLLWIAEREIADASVKGISDDGRFAHAYGAVRILCQIALHACGFAVPKGGRQHERLIESLKFTLGDEWSNDVDYFDRCRRMRHQAAYEGTGLASPADAAELLQAAERLMESVTEWLQENHQHLL